MIKQARERSGASEARVAECSEQRERTNVASDKVVQSGPFWCDIRVYGFTYSLVTLRP